MPITKGKSIAKIAYPRIGFCRIHSLELAFCFHPKGSALREDGITVFKYGLKQLFDDNCGFGGADCRVPVDPDIIGISCSSCACGGRTSKKYSAGETEK
ncbi:MAG: hypothetical protein QXF01_02335 [Candidatus Micrarchaeaceae archaeon]